MQTPFLEEVVTSRIFQFELLSQDSHKMLQMMLYDISKLPFCIIKLHFITFLDLKVVGSSPTGPYFIAVSA